MERSSWRERPPLEADVVSSRAEKMEKISQVLIHPRQRIRDEWEETPRKRKIAILVNRYPTSLGASVPPGQSNGGSDHMGKKKIRIGTGRGNRIPHPGGRQSSSFPSVGSRSQTQRDRLAFDNRPPLCVFILVMGEANTQRELPFLTLRVGLSGTRQLSLSCCSFGSFQRFGAPTSTWLCSPFLSLRVASPANSARFPPR